MRFSASQYHVLRYLQQSEYKSKFKASELEKDFQVDVEGISDEQILHSAVGIFNILCYGIFTYVATITGTKICARQNRFKTNTATGTN
jgi:hypothetical protein